MLLRTFLKNLVLPPGLFILTLLLAAIMLLLAGRIREQKSRTKTILSRLGTLTLIFTTLSLYLISTPFIASLVSHPLEHYPPLSFIDSPVSLAKEKEIPEAIVILGGGQNKDAREYRAYNKGLNETVDSFSLERLRYGAFLHRQTGLPILVTGGGDSLAVATLMADSLRTDFQVKTRWIETQSRTTWENAKFTREILAAEKIKHVYLVTHAFHMPRAVYSFEQNDFKVVPAPLAFNIYWPRADDIKLWVPKLSALYQVRRALHEYLGLWMYKSLSPEIEILKNASPKNKN